MAFCMRNVAKSLLQINLSGRPLVNQCREKITLPMKKKRNPIWFIRPKRVIHEDFVTPSNRDFIKEVAHDRYGAPSLIKGVMTYERSVDSSLIKCAELPEQTWTKRSRRTGLVVRKIGLMPLWKKDGTRIITTMLQVSDNHVIKYIPPNEYEPTQKPRVKNVKKFGCLVVGAECTDPSLLTKEYCGLFQESGVMPTKILSRFLVTDDARLNPATPLNVTHFRVGDYVDVRGKTVDRGFQGVMVRHGFKGMPRTHGQTKTHRRPGNIGGGLRRGLWKGTKLPGHMGNRYRILRGLKIWRINTEYNVMWVSGHNVAGEVNNICYVYDTMLPLRKSETPPPFPTQFEEVKETEIWHEDLHKFNDPTIVFQSE